MPARLFALLAVCLALAACSTERTTTTSRTATEQLLLSAAADRAAAEVARDVPPGRKTFVVADNFEAPQDGKYAIGAIRAAILARGAALVDDRARAEQIVEIRSGALGIDNSDTIIGIRESELPIPLTQSGIPIPTIALFQKVRQLGIAKFALAVYDAETGLSPTGDAPEPQFGYARKNDYTAAFVISWEGNDIYEPGSAPVRTLSLTPDDRPEADPEYPGG
ncbi:conserved exported hypothetical protein [uncultured Alphaproteobacteria bacterium]|uniref:Uncharacterized protein n=1 Tax=uncultured Alphaproteobacteria bacterium TaxID=91750 RepID=A0A212JQI8_9PROT|nr:conserved exported hypothetical protein [uncultured Alphaproteobacteria bacterium]